MFILSESAVIKLIDVFLFFFASFFAFLISSLDGLYGFVSSIILLSRSFIILDEYFSAKSGLCVTIITSLSLDISFIKSIICTDVVVSNAPVGSSAKIISGLFTKALAIATRCICPPESSFGFLYAWSLRPTFSRTSNALCFFSFAPTPLKVRLISTLFNTLI